MIHLFILKRVAVMKIILVQQQDIVKEALIDCFQRQQYHVVDLQQKMQIFDEIDSSQPVIMICNEGCLTEGEYAFYQKVSVVNQIPMIILTEKNNRLTDGLPEYIRKLRRPITFAKLVQLIEELQESAVQSSYVCEQKVIKTKNWELSMDTYELKIAEVKTSFSPKEMVIFFRLAKQPNTVVTRDELQEILATEVVNADYRMVDYHIRRIRKKLVPFIKFLEIKTVYGAGYQLLIRE